MPWLKNVINMFAIRTKNRLIIRWRFNIFLKYVSDVYRETGVTVKKQRALIKIINNQISNQLRFSILSLYEFV